MKFRTKKEEVPDQPQQPPLAIDGTPQTAAHQPDNAVPVEPAADTPPDSATTLLPPQPHPAEELLLRMRADFNNLRKRFDRERQEMVTLSNERLIRELLPVLDHFELALHATVQHKPEKAVQEGFRLVYDQLAAALAGFGLKPVDAQGKPFDPNFHEAIAQQSSTEAPDQVVLTQTRRGYLLGDRLLRPANVIVSSGPVQVAPDPAKE